MNLQQLRTSVWEANLDLNRHGLVTLTWGNVGRISEYGTPLGLITNASPSSVI